MSLINKVLHDLEDRHAFLSMQPQSVLSDLRSAQEYAHATRAARTPAMLFGLLALLFAVFIIAGSFWFDRAPTPSADAVAVKVPQQTAGAAPVATPVVRAAAAPEAAAPEAVAPEAISLRLKLDTLSSMPGKETARQAVESPAEGLELRAVRHAADGSGTSIHISFSAAPRYSLHVLENPDRLLIQLPEMELPPSLLGGFAPGNGISGLRLGREPGSTRLIFDLNDAVVIAGAGIEAESNGAQVLEVRLRSAAVSSGISPVAGTQMELETPLLLPDWEAEPEVVVVPSMQVVRRPVSAAQPAADAFALGAEAYRRGDIVTAIDQFQSALAADPVHLKARQFLVTLLAEQGDLAGATRYAVQGLEHHPQDPVLLRSHAQILFMRGDAQSALEVLMRTRPALEDDPDHYALMAAILQRQSRSADAADLYGRLVRLDANRGVWWAGLGIAFESLGRRADALRAFERALRDHGVPGDMRRYAGDRVLALSGRAG